MGLLLASNQRQCQVCHRSSHHLISDEKKWQALRRYLNCNLFIPLYEKWCFIGSRSVLKYKPGDSLCPRLIFKTFFTIMNFKSAEDILNCRLTRNGKAARPDKKLSYCQSLKDSKTIMKRFGIVDISEKSFKASGVTTLLDKKTSLSDVQVYGGWRSEQTPLYYHNSSITRRMDISSLLLQ